MAADRRTVVSPMQARRFGDHVRERRRELRISEVELARALGITARQLQSVEEGDVVPSEEVIGKMSALLRSPEAHLRQLVGLPPTYVAEG
ncbi:MAG: helix-turn-helix domain-containing protein [Candidatus Bathyarchaeia archaeon]